MNCDHANHRQIKVPNRLLLLGPTTLADILDRPFLIK
jgi:hypothetical protein